MRVSDGKERKNINIFKELIAESFPNLIKKIVMYISKIFNEFQ